MLGAIKYNFRHLFVFSGRDARSTFWYWFLFVVVLNIVVSLAISIPITAEARSTMFDAVRSGVDPAMARAAMIDEMGGMAGPLVYVSIALGLANVALLAASFVRRLHDSGKSAIFAIIAGAAQLVALYLKLPQVNSAEAMIRNAASTESAWDVFAIQGQLAWQGLIGWVPILLLIVFGVMKPDAGANRYGAEPVRF